MQIEWLPTGLSTISLLLAAIAVWFSLRASSVSRSRWSDSALKRSIDQQNIELADLREQHDHLMRLYKRFLARQRKREKKADEAPAAPDPQEDLPLTAEKEPNPYTEPEAWKRYKRKQIGVG